MTIEPSAITMPQARSMPAVRMTNVWPIATTPTSMTCCRMREKLGPARKDRKSTRLNSSHVRISYAVFCLKKKKINTDHMPSISTRGSIPLPFHYPDGLHMASPPPPAPPPLPIGPFRPSFFFNDTATTEIYTLSLHDALPI